MAATILQLPEPHTIVEKLYSPYIGSPVHLPVFLESVSAGFPSPADDYMEDSLDLNEKLIRNPAATFFMRVQGNSMKEAGIYPGDILIVDCSLTPCNNDIIIANLNGGLVVKRIMCKGPKMFLQSHNDSYEHLEITENTELMIWGVVTTIIHALR